MRLYALSGRREEALRQYERLGESLSREYAVEPDAASRRLYEEISAGRSPPAHSPPVSPPPEGPPDALRQAERHNLPIGRTSFVGRERELAEVERLLSETRLLTLTGAGGRGKTRLALEAATNVVGAYPDGVWLVELAGLSDPELVPREVADALGIREQPNRPLVETLVDAAARLVDALLGSCTNLRVLATSREVLGVANRQVPSLSLPGPGQPLTEP